MHLSYETIYRTLCVQTRGAPKKELLAHLRRRHPSGAVARTRWRANRAGRSSTPCPSRHDRLRSKTESIPGHWEGDLVAGAKNTRLATLVERHSRFVQLIKVPGKDTATVARALTRHVLCLPEGLMASLMWDRGLEMAQHQHFTVATDGAVCFCDPQSPSQRGTNENTNGLLGSQYLSQRH